MNPVYLFSLTSQHAQWATTRQATVTGNIANANTPGYAAREIESFSAVLDRASGLDMARTVATHIDTSGESGQGAASWGVQDTGAPVVLDRELIKADEMSRAFALDTSIMRSFHRMLLTSTRSGA